MLIAANGERTEFQTGRKIEPENWDNAKQQAKGKTAEAKLLNAYLNQLRNKVYLKEIELMQRGFLISRNGEIHNLHRLACECLL